MGEMVLTGLLMLKRTLDISSDGVKWKLDGCSDNLGEAVSPLQRGNGRCLIPILAPVTFLHVIHKKKTNLY